MAFRIIWTNSAHKDLKAIVQYIKSDSPKAAQNFGFKLIREAESVAEFPCSGRVVPEENDPLVREVLCRPYRIVYKIDEHGQIIYLLRIWHSARGKPQL